MALLDKVKFHLWDPLSAVLDLVEKWNPTGCTTEKDYERSLYEWLHGHLQGVQVTKQFASGRVRADLLVGDKVIVELKVNLDNTGKFHRLIGQLEDYREWSGDVLVVLLGTATDPNLRKKLEKYAEKKSGMLLGSQQIRILTKQCLPNADGLQGRADCQPDDLKARILAAMRQKQRQNPAPLIFSVESISRMLDVTASDLTLALDDLERAKRIFYDNRTGDYCLQPMPWTQPRSIF